VAPTSARSTVFQAGGSFDGRGHGEKQERERQNVVSGQQQSGGQFQSGRRNVETMSRLLRQEIAMPKTAKSTGPLRPSRGPIRVET